ncbi:MAG: hypothetical protein ACM3NQ_05330 [Bacteroidales bacterium]
MVVIEEDCGLHIAGEEVALSARLLAEFREMPGLRITAAQAARLFSLNVGVCERLLAALVDAGALRTERGQFSISAARP